VSAKAKHGGGNRNPNGQFAKKETPRGGSGNEMEEVFGIDFPRNLCHITFAPVVPLSVRHHCVKAVATVIESCRGNMGAWFDPDMLRSLHNVSLCVENKRLRHMLSERDSEIATRRFKLNEVMHEKEVYKHRICGLETQLDNAKYANTLRMSLGILIGAALCVAAHVVKAFIVK